MKSDYEFYENKLIVVTGAAGSIGSSLVDMLVDRYHPSMIRAIDNNETGLHDLNERLGNPENLRILLGDVKDVGRLQRAFENADIVFHAAAFKHVPLCEFDPEDAIKTNIGGTMNVIDAALKCGVKRVINISTDKAVNPVNVMGATKLLTEKLMLSSNHYRGKREFPLFSCVRFGNVLNSRGSVIPKFMNQIECGGPLTITDKNMTRFFMTIEEATHFIMSVTPMAVGREIFVLDMPSLHIEDLADAMIELYPNPDRVVEKAYIGKRSGEKIHEELMTEEEAYHMYRYHDYLAVLQESFEFERDVPVRIPEGFVKSKEAVPLRSDTARRMLEINEIKTLLRKTVIRYI